MDRTKYRVWLISIVLAATIFGIFYYVYTRNIGLSRGLDA